MLCYQPSRTSTAVGAKALALQQSAPDRTYASIEGLIDACLKTVKTLEEQPRRGAEGDAYLTDIPQALARMVEKLNSQAGRSMKHSGERDPRRPILQDLSSKGLLLELRGDQWMVDLQRQQWLTHKELREHYREALDHLKSGRWCKATEERTRITDKAPDDKPEEWQLLFKPESTLPYHWNQAWEDSRFVHDLAHLLLGEGHVAAAYCATEPCTHVWIKRGSLGLVREKLKLKLVDKVYTPAEASLHV